MNDAKTMDNNIEPNESAFYEKQLEMCRNRSEKLTMTSNKLSLLRGVAFAVTGLFLFLGYQRQNPAFFVSAAFFGIAFILLIIHHSRLDEEQKRLKDVQSVLKEYIARFGDGWKSFSEDGSRYLSDDFLEARDLDLFGKNSLYQYICTAGTLKGQDRLALWLGRISKDFTEDSASEILEDIKSRQEAVAELAQKTDFCLKLETDARCFRNIGYEASGKTMDNFFDILKTETHFPFFCRILLRLFPILTLTLLFFALIGFHRDLASSLFILLALGQLMSAFLGYYRNNKTLSSIYQINRAIAPYRKLFTLIEQESFDSSCMNDLQKILLLNGSASSALKELEKIADAVRTRHNIYAFLACNSLFLHDYHCMERFGKWKNNYRYNLEPWLDALGNVEALISLSVISHTRNNHCLPEIADSKYPVLTASNIRHPLLNEALAIGNDINLTHRTYIITGSNMSGKTTFMRSIGINLALAFAGGFCTSSNMRVSLMKLCTSIRTEDNINEGISTFYAELLRIKQMVCASRKQIPLICIIDEIYKGTNSKDRIFAAKETIRNLSKPHTFTFVTTHDFELCDLEHDIDLDAKNYFFTEYYKDNKIFFDYKLRNGRCTTTNARYLLRMAGILK